MDQLNKAVRQASAAALIGVVVLIGNEGSAAVIPSRADIGMVQAAPSVEIFDAGNQPQHIGSHLKTLPFGGCERRTPVERVIKILGMGKERLGYFISWVWNVWDSAPLQQNPAMRNSHLEGWSSPGIHNYYFRAEGVPFFVGTDGDCSHPRPFVFGSNPPQFAGGPPQGSGGNKKKSGEEGDISIGLVENIIPPADKTAEYQHDRPSKNTFIFFGGLIGGIILFWLMTKCCP